MARKALGEVLFEFTPVGDYVKVVAVDPASGTEVAMVGAASATQGELERAALKKLEYRLGLRPRKSAQKPSEPVGRGILI
ncbi:MAG: serine hydroxymethyltransferase [Pseudomonadota bacterium]